jgi:plastocyanin
MRFKIPLILAAALIAAPLPAAVAGDDAYTLTIKDHRFDPAELKVPAGQKIKLTVQNLDSTPEEFESYELNREKIIPGGKSTSVYIGPLEAGRYPFFGEFHQDTAQGVLIAE